MDSGDRSALLCRPERAFMGKTKPSTLRSPALCGTRSNQDDDGDTNSSDRCLVGSCSTTKRKTMQHSTSNMYRDPRHEAAFATSPAELDRSKSVLVLRRCEDLNVRTGGFQKIEEAAHRLDIRRQRQQSTTSAPTRPAMSSAAERRPLSGK
ncbi:hypothetical protein PF005_g4977 [Phytophthora fragariae]|uniref:Uncharacterized protein n=2 Tax=Phytophthora fragariae TaxID=53985 RepID=A0A6A3M057_9STRA|nr:hypothetical protein PF009_g5436 [Phytophthora fragariae]KAE9023395.1 hypothetical protein PF011_g3995 [Phytophthora fragariae]KAE9128859.1 hypothetical protein PF010_g4349 [Phytophthora fragariae]KAE9129213.1 hypothetical protein PF007_g4998 [Phytophthora fragariae]KAE9151537.1 hypothetical protein PF006_g4175 [Phytophthora fragariae]